MKKLQLLILGCFLSLGIAVAQPPPPHPGGSGNQGASLPSLPIAACVFIMGAAVKLYSIKK